MPKQSNLSKIDIKQVCPYCLKAEKTLFGHNCNDLPPNFNYNEKISSATFFPEIYKKSDGIGKNGRLDVYKLNPVKYQILFLKSYNHLLNPENAEKSVEFDIQESINSNTTESLIQNHILIHNSSNLKQVCPFCFKLFNSLVDHHCEKLEEQNPNFAFRADLLFDDFFIYLYKNLKSWLKSGRVDLHKLPQKKYHDLFFKIYYRMIEMEQPSLESARMEKDYLSKKEKKKKSTTKLEEYEKKIQIAAIAKRKKVEFQVKQLCPYCFRPFQTLEGHHCSDQPENFDFSPKISESTFFEELYQKLHILTKTGRIDTHKVNRDQYSSLFQKYYNKLLSPKVESSSQQPRTTEKSLAKSQNKESDQSSTSLHADLGKMANEDFGDMDLLEIFSHDYDLTGVPKPSTTKGIPAGKNVTIPTSKDGMSLCFTCKNMINCPRGLDSTQMENCLKCKDYISSESEETPALSKKTEGSKKLKESLCMNCVFMMNCPRGKNSSEMENIYKCKKYQMIESRIPDSIVSVAVNPQILTTQDLDAEKEQLDNSKKLLLEDILEKWKKERGQLKVFCKKCETEMVKVTTTKKVFYRCSNYPDCKIIGDPWYISQAVKKGVVSHVEHGDLLVLYQYDENKNIVFISTIFSEGKLFL
ncbi:MAG: hypothetical protein ACTSVL_13235 [Promethearchaeota archaeon]